MGALARRGGEEGGLSWETFLVPSSPATNYQYVNEAIAQFGGKLSFFFTRGCATTVSTSTQYYFDTTLSTYTP